MRLQTATRKILARWCAGSTVTRAFTLLVTASLTVAAIDLAQAQSADEIIKKNLAAHGGAEKWAAVHSIKMEGSYVNFSDPEPFTLWRQRPDRYRFDTIRIGMNIIQAYDGEKAWWVNPMFGPPNDKPVPIPSENNLDKVTLRERLFHPPFWSHHETGHGVELLGKEDFDDQECYKLKVTLADSSEESWYIDAESFRIVGMTGDTYDFGRKTSVEMFFSDYRDVAGVQMPFLIESEYGSRYRNLEIKTIEINVDFEPSVFVMPDSSTWQGQ